MMLTPLEESTLGETRAKVRRQLDQGVSADEVRSRAEARLTKRLDGLAADAPNRSGVLRAHALHQRAVEQAIRDWEAERPR